MISKELFCDILAYIESQNTMSEELNKIFKDYSRIDFCDGAAFLDLGLESYMVAVLSNMFKDTGNWISWWMYETKFGHCAPGVYSADGKLIAVLDTAEELYDFLLDSRLDKKRK